MAPRNPSDALRRKWARLEPWAKAGELLKWRWRHAEVVVTKRPAAFQEAMLWCFTDDHTELVETLSRPISPSQQAELAWAIQERARRKQARPKRRRPKNVRLRMLTREAVHFFKAWRDLNEECRIDDWGHRGEMRDQACALVVELDGGDEADTEAVIDLLTRPVSRRNQ